MAELPRQSPGDPCPCGLASIAGCHCGNAEAIAAQLESATTLEHVRAAYPPFEEQAAAAEGAARALAGYVDVEVEGETMQAPVALVDELVRLRAFESKTLDLLNAVHRVKPDLSQVRDLLNELQAMR
jgi:hypothetical protein